MADAEIERRLTALEEEVASLRRVVTEALERMAERGHQAAGRRQP